MKIPLSTICDECGGPAEIFVDLGSSSRAPRCPRGHDLPTILTAAVPIGRMIYLKADYEYRHNRDYSMTIVLAAAAFESELSRLHYKWEHIRAIDNRSWLDEDILDEKLRRYRSVAEKIEGVAKLMHPAGLEEFLAAASELRRTIEQNFPSLAVPTLARDFQSSLFWPRNKILHAGYVQFTEDDAGRCLSFAALGQAIFEALDRAAR